MKNSQKIQITNSSGVSFGDVNQTILPGSGEETSGGMPRPTRILFLAANPPETSRLQLDREVKAIDQALRSSGVGQCFELEQSWAVGDREIQDSILRFQPDIVHLSGHGSRSGRVILDEGPSAREVDEGSPGRASTPEDNPVSPLARLFAAARGRIRCVVLNACHSEDLARAIAEHVDCVVGMSEAIEDESAIRFSWAFYNALGYGQSVQAAFELAAAHVALGGSERDRMLRLVARRSDPAKVSFSGRPSRS